MGAPIDIPILCLYEAKVFFVLKRSHLAEAIHRNPGWGLLRRAENVLLATIFQFLFWKEKRSCG